MGKIAAFPGCGAPGGLDLPNPVTMSVTLPEALPSCDHCVLRWEWTAHQQVSNIEFYTQCADVTILSDKPPTVPYPMTAISGIEHLPSDAGAYRDVYPGPNQELPDEQYLVGPAIATYSACNAGSTGCIGNGAPTPTPTPSPTPAPTTITSTAITTTAPSAPTPSPSPSPSPAP